MRLIDADALKEKSIIISDGPIYKEVIPIGAINNAPTVEQECYITGAQWDRFMKEHRRRTGAYDKIKAIIDGWAVDDDEHELLEEIADIIDEEAEDD